jgi:hypothetical protein
LSDDIQSTFGRDFLATFGHQCRLLRFRFAGDLEHIIGTGQLQIDGDGDRFFENAEVTILDVATVLAKVNRDGIGAPKFGQRCCPDGVRLIGFPGLANGGYMVDVYAQTYQVIAFMN